MKLCSNTFLIIIVGFFSFLIISCQPDDPDSEPLDRDKFIGTWTCSETQGPTYTVVITESASNQNEILLANYHSLGQNEKAKGAVSGFSLTIPEQPLCNGDYEVKGSGLMATSKKTISMQYTSMSGGPTDTITATYTKQ